MEIDKGTNQDNHIQSKHLYNYFIAIIIMNYLSNNWTLKSLVVKLRSDSALASGINLFQRISGFTAPFIMGRFGVRLNYV